MRLDIVRCDWCGLEREYDPHSYTTVTYSRLRPGWTLDTRELYDICDNCNKQFVDFFTTRTQKDGTA